MKKALKFCLIVLFATVLYAFSWQDKDLQESINRGEEIYTSFCSSCHLADGAGVSGVFPPLANSDYLLNDKVASIKAIKNGLQGEIEVNGEIYDNYMAALGLSDQEVMDVMNYILNSWNNNGGQVSLTEVKDALK